MSTIYASCVDQAMHFTNTPVIASGGYNEDKVHFTFCSEWTGYTKTAVFYNDPQTVYQVVLDINSEATVPAEVTKEAGKMYIGVFGVNGSTKRTSEVLPYPIAQGAILPSGVTPSSGVTLNVEYGATAPTDTSKLWIKGVSPAEVTIDTKTIEENIYVLTELGDLIEGTRSDAIATVGTKIYLFGGVTYASSSVTTSSNRIYRFNSDTEEVAQPATLPATMYGLCCAAVGTDIYLFGGYMSGQGCQNKIYKYDTEEELLWPLSTTLPNATQDMTCAAVGTKIYLFGGQGNRSGSWSTVNEILCFNTETNTISTMAATLPIATSELSCAAVGTKIYLFGGLSINCFDTETNTISTMTAAFPASRYYMGCTAGKIVLQTGTFNWILLFGGNSSSEAPSDDIYLYIPDEDTLEKINVDLPTAANRISAATVRGRAYLFGGCATAQYGSSLSSVMRFAVYPELAPGDIHILINEYVGHQCLLIHGNGVEQTLPVAYVYRGNENWCPTSAEAYLYIDNAWTNIME